MSNTNINPILEAAGELDDTVLENAFKRKKKKPIALIVIAAAVVVVSLLAGSAAVYWKPVYINGQRTFGNAETIHPDAVVLSLEEAVELGAYDIEPNALNGGFSYFINIKPSDMIEKYNLPSIINDNFSDEVTIDDISSEEELHYLNPACFDEEKKKLLPGTKVMVNDNYAYFDYFLVDKQSKTPVYVSAIYTLYKTYPFGFQFHKGDVRVIDLNTGEKAVLQRHNNYSSAYFYYRGVSYTINGMTDIDGMNQILKDFGITAE